MSKIFISTTLSKALDCFSVNSETEERTLLSKLGIADSISPIKQFSNKDIYFHFDVSNPNDADNTNEDFILKHNQSNPDFVSKFTKIVPSTHNRDESSKFRQVFKILLNNEIHDKYNAIKSQIFSDLHKQNSDNEITDFLDYILKGHLIDENTLPTFLSPFKETLSKSIEWFSKKKFDPNATDTNKEEQHMHFCLIRDALVNQ